MSDTKSGTLAERESLVVFAVLNTGAVEVECGEMALSEVLETGPAYECDAVGLPAEAAGRLGAEAAYRVARAVGVAASGPGDPIVAAVIAALGTLVFGG